jgi:hypothetical protein
MSGAFLPSAEVSVHPRRVTRAPLLLLFCLPAFLAGGRQSRTDDALNRLTNLVSSRLGNTIASYQYTVLPSGHRQTASEAVVTPSGTRGLGRSYGYDSTYRLTVENLATAGITNLPTSASVSYTLDDVGNRLARNSTLPGVSSTANTYDANDRLDTDSYDANGNTVVGRVSPSAPLVSDAYDFEDRLINRNNGQVIIVYDGDGN